MLVALLTHTAEHVSGGSLGQVQPHALADFQLRKLDRQVCLTVSSPLLGNGSIRLFLSIFFSTVNSVFSVSLTFLL